MMSWCPCLAARSRGVFLFLSRGSNSTVLCVQLSSQVKSDDFQVKSSQIIFKSSHFILEVTFAQSSLTAARLPEMQARCRGEDPKLSGEKKEF